MSLQENTKNYQTEEIQKPGFDWEVTGADHVTALNSGRMLGIYRGHGSPYSAPANFESTDVAGLNNSGLLPVMFFVNCLSGVIYDDLGPIASISKQLINKQDSGAVGVLASTKESFAGSNDAFTKALINALWPNPGVLISVRQVIDYKLVSAAMPDTVDVKDGNYNVYWSNLTEGIATLTVDSDVKYKSEISSEGKVAIPLSSVLIPAGSTKTATIKVTSKHCRPLIKDIVITNTR